MKNLSIFLITILLFACESKEDVQRDIDILRTERSELSSEVRSLKKEAKSANSTINTANEKLRELSLTQSGDIGYVLVIELRQVRTGFGTLDWEKQIKDEMNATKFPMEVSKKSYNHYSIGDLYLRKARDGSAWMESFGTTSDWQLKVVDKKIVNTIN